MALNQWTLERIGNEAVRDDYANKSGGSGRELFRILATDVATALSPKVATALVNCLTSIFDVGMLSPSVPSFNTLVGAARQVNLALPKFSGKRRDDSVIAEGLLSPS